MIIKQTFTAINFNHCKLIALKCYGNKNILQPAIFIKSDKQKMKKTILTLTLFSISLIASFGQTKSLAGDNLKEKIIALEKEAWKAWQDKNPSWFQNNATDECLWVTQAGVSNKDAWIKTGANACDVKSYTLDNFQLVMLDK
ncbi:MAG TPA: hypothetical protein VL307_04265, partial [Chitinophagaceae bacterium]|nr:hypothetical protein [Chitinophagaceae bacterium]